ncbi:diguanylate cyclase [Gayadomonas joobiniege]|uniref:sensor domain-containing diguanylate cyclase n=1 Tax=Gayadomonas joobiniege TaxID=1234606 RepID=UPI00036FB914|nr:diguanylate cyclase [Gayadomonas joobiniege]
MTIWQLLKEQTQYAVIYFLLTKICIFLFAEGPDAISMIWLPAGLSLYLYVRKCGIRILPTVFIASFAANYSGWSHESLMVQILSTSATAFAASFFTLFAGELTKWAIPNGVNTPSDMLRFLLYSCLLPCLIVSFIITATVVLGDYAPPEPLSFIFFAICLSNMLGVLLMASVLSSYERREYEAHPISRYRLLGFSLAMASILASFYFGLWIAYLALPAFVMVIFNSKSFYSYTALFVLICVFYVCAIQIFPSPTYVNSRLELIAFLFAVSYTFIAMATQQRRLLVETSLRIKWERMARHDQLTGLANRESIYSLIRDAIEKAQVSDYCFNIVLIDIDHFKAVNDTYGHSAGDKVLTEFAKRLGETIRATDAVGRVGGEEFLLFLPDTDNRGAFILLKKIKAAIVTKRFLIGDISIKVTFSAGISQYKNNMTIDNLIEYADQKLYQAKRAGRNRVY